MNPYLSTFVAMGLQYMEDLNTQSEIRKKEILEEWERSKNYPRKKKKRVMRELRVDWAIANWNPFDIKF